MMNSDMDCGIPKVFKHKDTDMVECLHSISEGIHTSGYMDPTGKLYIINSENPYPIANTIEELLEKHAIYYSLLRKQNNGRSEVYMSLKLLHGSLMRITHQSR